MSISQKVQRLGLLGSVKTLISIETTGLQQNGVCLLSPVFESVSNAFSEGTIHLLHLVAKKRGWLVEVVQRGRQKSAMGAKKVLSERVWIQMDSKIDLQ